MRLIQLAIPGDILPDIERTLVDEGLDYYTTSEADRERYDTIVHFVVEPDEVEPMLDRLYESGLSSEDHGVIVDVETDLFEEVERSQASESKSGPNARIADAELRAEAGNQIMDPYSFVQMTVLSALVATVGLILDSAAVIIGAMVIAPLLGPALSSTVGTVLGDQDLFWRGVGYQAAGVVVAVASTAAFAWGLRYAWIAPPGMAVADTAQIAERLSPDILSLILALAAGAAGVLSLATRTKSAIVGVMIAAALIPPAATAGLGIAWGYPVVAMDAGILVVVNLLSINLAGLAVFWYLGYRPPTWLGAPTQPEDGAQTLGNAPPGDPRGVGTAAGEHGLEDTGLPARGPPHDRGERRHRPTAVRRGLGAERGRPEGLLGRDPPARDGGRRTRHPARCALPATD